MTDPMRLYQKEARSVRPSADLEKRTVELIRELEREKDACPIPEKPVIPVAKTTSRKNRMPEGILRYAALVAGVAIALLAAVPVVFWDDGGITVGEASAIELEVDRMFISDPRSSVLEIDGDSGNARVVLNAELSCVNTGEAMVAIEADGESLLFIRRCGEDEWRDGIVLRGGGVERVELSILVSIDEEDVEAFRTGSGLADSAYARLIAQASQQLSTCFLSLECEGFLATEYAIEPEFETDWRTVRRMVNAGDRLRFSLLLR